ncbi:MAG: hypothetical protein HN521_21650 [Candidatus Latescibacteria bacterium]|jgi:hypothetical protein|nr:hypothetical protein [Candidatus Latescibacterota bacterium]MBT5831484.1 hypothetical protein [Candidatus Latescibacterota bacterium]
MNKLKYAFMLCFALTTAPAFGFPVGQTISNFRLPDLNGTFHADTDYRGKVLILAVIGYN